MIKESRLRVSSEERRDIKSKSLLRVMENDDILNPLTCYLEHELQGLYSGLFSARCEEKSKKKR